MEQNQPEQQAQTAKLDKAFFSQTGALKIQYDPERPGIFLGIGKKANDTWTWKTAKLKDVEAAQIIRLIQGKTESIDLYHTFETAATRISISKNEKDEAYFKIDDHAKKLDPNEQEVLRIILQETIRQAAKERPRSSRDETM